MNSKEYLTTIEQKGIRPFGFDTHARVLGIPKDDVKILWNDATNREFKRAPRTEYTMRYLPEYSSKFNPFWRLETPDDYLMFYLTPTSPIVIPNGLITDKGSIPLIFQNLISIYDREMMFAFLAHDVERGMNRMTKFTSDGLLYEVGTVMEANWFKKNFVYTAVRMAAWLPGRDRIKDGFNINEYNRQLIREVDKKYLESKHSKHVADLDFLRVTI